MSEREDIFFTKAERCLEGLEKTKAWYRNAVVILCISLLGCASGAGVVGYRLGQLDSEMDKFATKKSVELWRESNETLLDTYALLIKDKFKEAEASYRTRSKITNDNIFSFTTERGGKE